MGKLLIIKNADFSANALDNMSGGYWLFNNNDIARSAQPLNATAEFWPSGETVSSMLRGKHVTKTRFKCGAAGTLSILHVTSMIEDSAVLTTLATISCSSSDVGNVVEKDVDFTFPNSGFLAIKINEAGVMDYFYDQSITTEEINWNPVHTAATGEGGRRLVGRFFNNDFFISFV